VKNDQADGDGILFYQDSDSSYIAEFSSVPTPFLGVEGSGAYPIAPLTTTRHIVVKVKSGNYDVTVNGTRTGDYSVVKGCGEPIFAAWGGVTAHIDHVIVD